MRVHWLHTGLLAWTLWLVAAASPAYENGERLLSEPEDDDAMTWNLPSKTLGGKQLWTDELIHGQWRIQRNAITGHCRLLDPDNVRRAWGSWDTCFGAWNEYKRENEIPPLRRKVILVLHGLGRSRSSMQEMADYLAAHTDCSVLNFSYASTRATVADDAASLAKVIGHLEGVEEVSFVAHSMGNLVVRHFLADQRAATGNSKLPQRLGRMVMLAPPNNGAALARRFENNPVFQWVFGTGGATFTQQWEELEQHLIAPPCPFGIIAGGAEDGDGRNPLLEGNDDMVVRVDETRLAGARDFVVVPAAHTFIMDDDTVREYTLRFLQYGYFVAEDLRQPLTSNREMDE